MPRKAPDPALVLKPRPRGTTLTRWLYDELRDAILGGRLHRGARLPATRDLARVYSLSRRVVVNVYEQLRDEGYLESRVGAGTVVSPRVPEDYLAPAPQRAAPPSRASLTPSFLRRPARPFRPIEPALDEFPIAAWSRVSARVLRRAGTGSLAGGAIAGDDALREEIAAYLGASRGVACSPDQIAVVSGTQQSLDLLARLLIRPGDPVWMEDPAYTGAVEAFRNARARIVPVRVDAAGLDPAHGRRLCPRPRAVYLTPAHQFALGSTLSLDRRLDLLRWARTAGAVLIEDDYDSEFRFTGRPLPALKGLAGADGVFLLGSFNKVLFPALRLAYIVVPDPWIDRLLALRFSSDRYPPSLSQAILARFMTEGHFARHLRRMRELYAHRRTALERDARRYLDGVLRLPEVQAGLNTPAFLVNGMNSADAAARAAAAQIEAWPLDRFALRRRDIHGFLLGFAAFNEREIRTGVLALARGLA